MVDLNLRRGIDLEKEAFNEKDRNINPYADFNNNKKVIPISKGIDHGKCVERNAVEAYVGSLCEQVGRSPDHCHPKEYFHWDLFVHVIKSTFMFFKLSRFCVDSEGISKEFPEFRHSSSCNRGKCSAARASRSDKASCIARMYS